MPAADGRLISTSEPRSASTRMVLSFSFAVYVYDKPEETKVVTGSEMAPATVKREFGAAVLIPTRPPRTTSPDEIDTPGRDSCRAVKAAVEEKVLEPVKDCVEASVT